MGLKYTGSFDAIRTQNRYTIEIYQDSYSDDPIEVILGATPVVQEWQEDDPLAPIKGSTLTINLTTSGGLSLLDFYSDNDNEYNVKLIEDTSSTTLFDGFILQDDCSEVQVDFIHIITLTATDNLGTIKDITLGRAAELFGDIITETSVPCAFNPAGPYIVINLPSWPVQPGQTFTIDGTPFTMVANLGEIDMSYTGWCIQIVEEIPTLVIGTFDITYREIVSLDGYIPLLTFIKLCLRATYVDNLGLNVINHITPADGVIFLATGETRMFEDVLILSNTFLKNNEYLSCYDVLEIIMKRFNMTCFQSLNSWWIVRYPDLFLDYQEGETLVDYYRYEPVSFAFDAKYSINKSYIIATGNYVETGLLKSIVRPFRRTLETFNYVQPEDLLVNSQFTDLGALVTQTTGGGDTFRYYEAPGWFVGSVPEIFYIRTVTDANNEETERTFFIGNSGDGAKSTDIILEQNDVFEFSFQIRTDFSTGSGFNYSFILPITNGSSTLYLDNNGNWNATWTPFLLTFSPGVDAQNFASHTIKAKVPFDCILNIILNGTAGINYWKDLRFAVQWQVAGQGLINGHTHNASQSKKLNNINDVEIFIDNSERSSISGTLFENRVTGVLQDKITNWKFGYGYNTGEPLNVYQNLGQLITSTYMFQRYIPRTKFNGNLLYVRNANGVLSNLAIFSNEFAGPSLHNKMLLGSIAIDYYNDSAEFTMWEVFNRTLPLPADNFTEFESYLYNILYQFNYLYENN